MKEFKGKLALVTGASSGLGKDFAKQLAAYGADLVITARRESSLNELAEELRTKHGVTVDVVALDLSKPEGPKELYEAVKNLDLGKPVEVLINNAGFGAHGDYLDTEWEKLGGMLQLNMVTLAELTHLYGREMKARNSGYIMNLASIGSFQPAPSYATYAATKAFVLNLTEAINFELRGSNVKVSALCPGITRTEFFDVAGQEEETLFQKVFMMESPEVVKMGLKALVKNKASFIPGYHNQGVNLISRVTPRKIQNYTGYFLMNN